MPRNSENIGLIAGGGKFPLLAADAAKKHGFRVVAVAHMDETDPLLSDIVDHLTWVKLGQLGKLINTFKKNDVTKALMAGSINKQRMFGRVAPDLKGLALISKIAVFHDDSILKAVAREFSKEGIEIVSSTKYLPELIAPEGRLTKRKPSKSEKEDIQIGWSIAKEMGRMDVGQCVVIKRRTVLALEAIDGTNATILRGGRLAGGRAVVVKVSKPNQDLRFDVPSVGLETVKQMAQVGASVLALEAGKTLIFEKENMIDFADESDISIISMSDRDIGNKQG